MAVLKPDHLFEQASRLIAPPAAGHPRHEDLRRAISAAYYGVFHHLLTAAADEFVGVTQKQTRRYSLVYRSVDHQRLRDLCSEAKRQKLAEKYADYVPDRDFGPEIRAFASAFLELQEKRHSADYDPSIRVKTSDARLAIDTAKSAVQRFQDAEEPRRKAFLALMLFKPR